MHSRSLLVVAILLVYLPAAQGTLADVHGSPSFESEYVVPAVHAAHTRLVETVPAADCPSPIGHVLHGVHESTLVTLLLVPAL